MYFELVGVPELGRRRRSLSLWDIAIYLWKLW